MFNHLCLPRFISSLCVVLLCTVSFAEGYTPGICPTPESARISSTDYSALRVVSIECSETAQASEWAERHLKEWFGDYAPKVKVKEICGEIPVDGAYSLDISKGSVKISAGNLAGVRYALYSLRQITIAGRGTKTVQGWIVPEAQVVDRPALSFRGIHFCWFPETEAVEMERNIRMAAYYKFNYAVIESWGTFRSESNPWLGWPDGKMTKAEISRLKAIADDLGICLIPQFNVFGHASGSRIRGGKHATLDFSPEYQPLFEPEGGWNWCLSNPETFKVQSEMICELLDVFGNPPFFHIGCDEAEAPSCPDCISQSYSDLFVNHIRKVCCLLEERGARAMMWHDMLLERGDPRWSGFYAYGTKETSDLSRLPKSIIVCDWFYGDPWEKYPTLDYFKSQGFDVLTSPKINVKGIYSQGQYARSANLYGVLGTTWADNYGLTISRVITQLSDAVWSVNPRHTSQSGHSVQLRFATHLRQIGWDMHISEYENTGFYHYQIDNDIYRQ